MDNDDKPIGHLLSRREALKLLGVVSVAMLAGCAPGSSGASQPTRMANPGVTTPAMTATTAAAGNAALPSCVVIPEMTEGPYFVDEQLNRSDIRSDPATGIAREGLPLLLDFNVSQISNGGCVPLANAMVDVWHCDAAGVYSDVSNAVGQKFLRGYQVTDTNGLARFTTIYPGWYPGRTVHIHFKVRTTGADGNAYEFTSQLFFDEAVTAKVYAQAPYRAKGMSDTPNARDGIYRVETLLTPTEANGSYSATLALALDLSDAQVGAADGNTGGPP